MPTLNDVLTGSLAAAVQVQQIIDAMKGTPNKGVPVALVALNDPNNYALSVQNKDPTNSRALSVLKADGTTLISADIAGVTLGSPLHIPASSIGSNEITDGSIATVDLAAGAVSQVAAYIANAGNSTTSASMVQIAGTQTSLTTIASSNLLVWFNTPLYNASAAGVALGLQLDGGAVAAMAYTNLQSGSQTQTLSACNLYTGQGAGAHTVKLYWQTTAGTLTQNAAAQTILLFMELRR